MLREEHLRRLINDAYVDLFLAGVDGARIYWPWRMARENGSLSDRYREACEVYWVDSSIQNEDYGNQDVLDDAHEVGAEAVLLADTMGELDATVDAVLEGIELADNHPFDGDVIVPLQPPYDECYAELAGQSEYYAIGGLKDEPNDAVRIQAAETVRELAGRDVHLHGLGWGPRDELARELADRPWLLDSIDYSSPVQSSVGAMPGDEHSTVTAAYAGARLVRDLRKVTPHVDFEPDAASLRGDGQLGFEDLGAAAE